MNSLTVVLLALGSIQMAGCQAAVHDGGLFFMLLEPFSSTLKLARRLIGGNAGQRMSDDGRAETFEMFARLYNKSYSPAELPRRMELFFERRREIEASVRAYNEGRLPFMMRENAFTDWEVHELRKLAGAVPPLSPDELLPEEKESLSPPVSGRQRRSILDANIEADPTNAAAAAGLSMGFEPSAIQLPASKDWRTSGCISEPINQLKCGACYAIATMSVMETMRCLHSDSSPRLSPQQIVDCATPDAGYQNFGCQGGWPTRVLRYLQTTGVAVREICYPFVWHQQACQLAMLSSRCFVAASYSDDAGGRLSFKVLNNERDILYHVAKTGPVVTVVRATESFLHYGSGIFDDPSCTRRQDDVDHAIVIVGYGRENGQDYWLIKNSWGVLEWGQLGYGKYRRGTNACSIGHWAWVVTS